MFLKNECRWRRIVKNWVRYGELRITVTKSNLVELGGELLKTLSDEWVLGQVMNLVFQVKSCVETSNDRRMITRKVTNGNVN